MNDFIKYDTSSGEVSYVNSYNCSGEGIIDLIKNVKNPIGIEIGSDVGETASYLLETRKDLFLHCIDPYETYIDWNGNNLNDREAVLKTFVERMKPYEDRYDLLKMKSDRGAKQFFDDSVDFVFIDGLHEYEQTLRDCLNYWPIVKSGGLFCGHDYNTIPGVNKSVNEFANRVNKQILTTTNDVWYFYK